MAWDEHCEHVPYRAGDRQCRKRLPLNLPAHGFSCIASLAHRFAISILRFSSYLAALLFEHQRDQCQRDQGKDRLHQFFLYAKPVLYVEARAGRVANIGERS